MEQGTEQAKVIPMTSSSRSLVRKLSEVMAMVERVPKSGHNDHHNYDFATEADITQAVRMEMARRQLMVVPSAIDAKSEPVGDKGMRLFTQKMRFTVMDGESGESISFDMYGQGYDNQDKGAYKATTGALKYALLKLFLIPTGDDPEKDAPRNATASPPSGANGLRTKVLRKPAPPAAPHIADAVQRASQRNGTGAVFPNYGSLKGQPIFGAAVKDLEFYANGARRTLADPQKARFHDAERRLLAAIDAELARQRGLEQPDDTNRGTYDEPPPPTDTDAPF